MQLLGFLVCVGKISQGGPEPYIHMYIRCTYGILSKHFTIHTVIYRVGRNHIYTVCIQYFWQGNNKIYGVYIRFWPTLVICHKRYRNTVLAHSMTGEPRHTAPTLLSHCCACLYMSPLFCHTAPTYKSHATDASQPPQIA